MNTNDTLGLNAYRTETSISLHERIDKYRAFIAVMAILNAILLFSVGQLIAANTKRDAKAEDDRKKQENTRIEEARSRQESEYHNQQIHLQELASDQMVYQEHRLAREELRAVLSEVSKERLQLTIGQQLLEQLGIAGEIGNGYIAFGHRSMSDLQIQHCISLMERIKRLEVRLVSTASKVSRNSDPSSATESHAYSSIALVDSDITNKFAIATILSQNGNLLGGRVYANECVHAIDSSLSTLDSSEQSSAKRELYTSIKIDAMTLIAVIDTIEKCKDVASLAGEKPNIFQSLDGAISEATEANWSETQKVVKKASLIAIKALLAIAILDKQGDAFQAGARKTFVDLEASCNELDGLPKSPVKTFVEYSREFVFTATATVRLNRAAMCRLNSAKTAELIKEALEDIRVARIYTLQLSENQMLLRKLNMEHFVLLAIALDFKESNPDSKESKLIDQIRTNSQAHLGCVAEFESNLLTTQETRKLREMFPRLGANSAAADITDSRNELPKKDASPAAEVSALAERLRIWLKAIEHTKH